MKRLKKPEPGNVPTRDSPADYTGESAPERTLFINLGFIKYGTNDKTQGAAVLFSFMLLIALIFLIIYGMLWGPSNWLEKSITWIQGAFILIVGIAIGKSISSSS